MSDSEDKPSIIKEIFIYDKPNKPAVPQDYFSSNRVTLTSGDIILTRSRKKAIKVDPSLVKTECEDDQFEEISTPLENVIRLPNNILNPNTLVAPHLNDDVETVPEFTMHSRPKRSYGKKQTELSTETIGKPQLVDSPKTFKKPVTSSDDHSSLKTPQKVSSKETAKVLNFFIKHPSLDVTVLATVRDNSVFSLEQTDAPDTIEVKSKRTRKLPKRYGNDDVMVEETVGHYSPSTPIGKRRKVELDEEEIPGEEEEQEFVAEPSSTVSDSEQDAYQSDDEDGPREWMPPEYVKYKQEFATKRVEKKVVCALCNASFDTYYGLRKHRAMRACPGDNADSGCPPPLDKKSDKDSEDSNTNSQRKVLYKCKICLMTFTNYYKLTTHRKDKHENATTPYDCRECNTKFASITDLTAHIRGTHQGKDPYECQKCKKGFQSTEELTEHSQIHVLQKPEVVKKYRCDICKKEFAKLSEIERHTRVHTGEKPSECHICHKRFQQSHNLTKHLLIHMQVKPFQCEICHKKFGRIDVMNRHMLTHSVEKPFKCSFCDKSFIRQIQLSVHLDKHHPDADYGEVDSYS
ncbi:zinc finger protein 724-like [Anthonomus grandis grandis]|uniref:zinc finger protein 724-like n=1 Tax=Anthonomus grandis grandis TaxID=2921223 RepID=UPI002164F04A|nr:zinc finger protein 724-like [Anthonomus grandis grandis]